MQRRGGLWLFFYAGRPEKSFYRANYWLYSTFAALLSHLATIVRTVAKPVTPHSSMLSSFAANRFGVRVEAEEEAAGDDDAACLACLALAL